MAQLTNKCNDEDIEYYVRECGDILGVTQNVENPDDPKAILHYIFMQISISSIPIRGPSISSLLSFLKHGSPGFSM